MSIFDEIFKRKKSSTKQVVPSVNKQTKSPSKSNVSTQTNNTNQLTNTNKSKISLKVTDTANIKSHIILKEQPPSTVKELFCPIRKAKIYCHSILIDKLGDLTKFIILSLYEGYSIEEISNLTQMGDVTMKEEIDYLVRGGIVNDDRLTLTDLGDQYGILLTMFKKLSCGIDVVFNEFANIFEPVLEDYETECDNNTLLKGSIIMPLLRNDNYANSLDIAIEHIEPDTPFCSEIKNSLYATIKVDNETLGYKKVYLKDFCMGEKYSNEPSVRIAIPIDKVIIKARYEWIDQYRSVINETCIVAKNFSEQLLSDKGKQLVNAATEEVNSEDIILDINTITGSINNDSERLVELPSDKSIIVLKRNRLHIILDSDKCAGIRCEELERKELYQIQYFSYRQMEEK